MARRRSLNRRWSRRSGNLTELDRDSEIVDDTSNPMWWNNLPDATEHRPSGRISNTDTTGSILGTSSKVDETELQDEWWNNLDRTNLQSSRRYSTRKSLNPEETVQESLASSSHSDVSIKKRKVLLRARQKRSGGTETFLRALEDSDVAQSEPLPSRKRKIMSPTAPEFQQSKTSKRHSRSLVDGERNDNSVNTSNDTDIIVKARPKAFSKRATRISSGVYDEILTGPSGINSSNNASRSSVSPAANRSVRSRASHSREESREKPGNTPVKALNSNESGSMGPPIGDSLRRRLSTVSKTLNLTSSESEAEAKSSKPRKAFQLRSKRNDSLNPFDEILSGHLNASTSSAGTPNKSTGSANTSTRISKSLKQNQTLPLSTKVNEEEELEEIFTSESQSRDAKQTHDESSKADKEIMEIQGGNNTSSTSKARISERLKKNTTIEEVASSQFTVPDTQEDPRQSISRTKNSTMIDESLDFEQVPQVLVDNRKSSLMSKINPRASKRLTRNTAIDEVTGEFQSQVFADWESSGSEEDGHDKKGDKSALNRSNQSSVSQKLPLVSINRLTSADISRGKKIGQLEKDEKQEKILEPRTTRSRSLRPHSRTQADSAYELPNRDRSTSPIISVSENESIHKNASANTSRARESSKNTQKNSRGARESVIQSVSRTKSNVSRNTNGNPGDFLPLDSGELATNEKSRQVDEINAESRSNSSVREKNPRRKSIANLNASQEQNSDQSISEELAASSLASNLNQSKGSTRTVDNPQATESKQGGQLETSLHKEDSDRSRKSGLSLSRKSSYVEKNRESRKSTVPTNATDENDHLGESISEAETEIADSETSQSINENFKMEERNASRERSSRPNASRNRIDSDQSVSEEEINLEPTNRSKNESGTSRKRSTYVSRNRTQSDEIISQDESNVATTNRSKNESGTSRKRSAQVSRNRIESDESISEEEINLEPTTNRSDNESGTGRKRSTNFSRNRTDSDESTSRKKSNLTTTNRSKNESGTRKKRSTYVSENRTESDASIGQEESNVATTNRSKNESGTSQKRSAQVSKNRTESDETISEEEINLEPTTNRSNNESGTGRKTVEVSKQRLESEESDREEDSENRENANLELGRNTSKLSDISKSLNKTNRQDLTIAGVENTAESITIPSEEIPLTPSLTKLPENKTLDKTSKTQKNIMDFFPSNFLQRTDNSKPLASLANFDREKLDLAKKEVERKRELMVAMKIKETAKKKQISVGQRSINTPNAKKSRPNGNMTKAGGKPPKVVDKAYIVNGQVYKRPKLPRPKPWVTDRLYAHLWKKMEPKYDLRTRIKSESFVQQLAEVVALVRRRKKYDSYKNEVDALMKEMARLNIIKTRDDFYHFCYDYLPYEFRVKVTPILLPGNVQLVPYDPTTLHTPILPPS